jgi:hypothetical protein
MCRPRPGGRGDRPDQRADRALTARVAITCDDKGPTPERQMTPRGQRAGAWPGDDEARVVADRQCGRRRGGNHCAALLDDAPDADHVLQLLGARPRCYPIGRTGRPSRLQLAITRSAASANGAATLVAWSRTAVRCGQAGASALLVIGADVGDLRAGLVSLVLGWLV